MMKDGDLQPFQGCCATFSSSGSLSRHQVLVTGADEVSEPERKTITVEVWDYKMVNYFRGVAQVPLKDVLDNHRIRDTFRWLPCPSISTPGGWGDKENCHSLQ